MASNIHPPRGERLEYKGGFCVRQRVGEVPEKEPAGDCAVLSPTPGQRSRRTRSTCSHAKDGPNCDAELGPEGATDRPPVPRSLGPNMCPVVTLMSSSDAEKSGSSAPLPPGAGSTGYTASTGGDEGISDRQRL